MGVFGASSPKEGVMRTSRLFELTFTRENFRRLKLELLWYRGAYGEPPEDVFPEDEDNDNNGTDEGSQPDTTR